MKRMPFATLTRKVDRSVIAVAVAVMLAGQMLSAAPARGESVPQDPSATLATEGDPLRLLAQRDLSWNRVLPSAPRIPAMTPIPPATGAGCIDEGQTCVVHGTPCCGSYECKGTFPNTTCQ